MVQKKTWRVCRMKNMMKVGVLVSSATEEEQEIFDKQLVQTSHMQIIVLISYSKPV